MTEKLKVQDLHLSYGDNAILDVASVDDDIAARSQSGGFLTSPVESGSYPATQ